MIHDLSQQTPIENLYETIMKCLAGMTTPTGSSIFSHTGIWSETEQKKNTTLSCPVPAVLIEIPFLEWDRINYNEGVALATLKLHVINWRQGNNDFFIYRQLYAIEKELNTIDSIFISDPYKISTQVILTNEEWIHVCESYHLFITDLLFEK